MTLWPNGLCRTPRVWWDRSDRARSPLSPSADLQQQLHPHMSLVGGFTAVKPSDDHFIRDAGGHRIAPDAAEVVVVRRLNVALSSANFPASGGGFKWRFQTAVSGGGFTPPSPCHHDTMTPPFHKRY